MGILNLSANGRTGSLVLNETFNLGFHVTALVTTSESINILKNQLLNLLVMPQKCMSLNIDRNLYYCR
jgi:putative NADH-flavin reductase